VGQVINDDFEEGRIDDRVEGYLAYPRGDTIEELGVLSSRGWLLLARATTRSLVWRLEYVRDDVAYRMRSSRACWALSSINSLVRMVNSCS